MHKKKKSIFRRIRLRTIFLLFITLASNSFAWFIYSTKISNSITAKVQSWNVIFKVGDTESEEFIEFNVENLYPGMEDYEKVISVTNNGDSNASLSYEVESVKILGEELNTDTISDEDILLMLQNNYPFHINLTLSNQIIAAQTGEENVTFTLTWPYESGNDELDTLWGNKAYMYHQDHPEEKSISLLIKLSATQEGS